MSRLFNGWPAGIRGAVSLSFDDAAVSQLIHAVPTLDAYEIRGTFYVNPGENSTFEQHADQWRAVHEAGHEIGNHTIAHPCSASYDFVRDENALENWTLAKIAADIDEAQRRLHALIPDLGSVSFAYPCGETYVGAGDDQRSYIPVVAERFTVARGVGDASNDPLTCDLHNVHTLMVYDVRAQEMIDMVEASAAQGHWVVFCFHGIGGDHLAVAAEEFAGLVRYLHEQKNNLWVDTVQRIGTYVAKGRGTHSKE